MAEERRKKRSHAEVVAAREQYLKEREERQKARAERKAAREAKQQARAERQAERAKLIAERQARKEQREKLKSMTEAERAQVKYELKLEKARKASKKEDVHPMRKILPYKGDLVVGQYYTIRFAGGLIYGKFLVEKMAGMEENGIKYRHNLYIFESKKPRSGGGFWTYPVLREDILCEGILTEEKCGGLLHPTFNGISYY